ncbi:AAA family ATPase [Nitrosopumilus sp. b3]|uniref:Cdc6/Cdc18 family protein n=1 Tax=Nitrosopumilus sp. b3 TaxID=2109909 RepID=UPI0015F3E0E4|nr:AAA family ATPase [Nitrosopumilus sp. b3]
MKKQILLDRSVFEDTFIPETFVSRENHIREIIRHLQPVKNGDFSQYLYIHGPPGGGKTAIIRSILKENFPKQHVYVNCFRDRTANKIMEEVLLHSGIMFSGRESTRDMIKKFEKSKKRMLICLDEADYIKDTDILGVFVRNLCGLILISNNHSFSKIDSRLRSRIFFNEVEFNPYEPADINQILTHRISYGLRDGCINDNLLSVLSKFSNGDARIGLQTLKIAANEAESNNSETITMDEIKLSAKRTRKYRLSLVLGELNEHQLKILDILKEHNNLRSGELMRIYRQRTQHDINDRTYRNYMMQLVDFALVKEGGTTKARTYEILL